MVQRYILEDECVVMEKHDRGDWVNYEDYDKLRKERDELKEELKTWKLGTGIVVDKKWVKELEAENAELKDALKLASRGRFKDEGKTFKVINFLLDKEK